MWSAAKVLIPAVIVVSIATRAESTTISVDFSTNATAANVGALYPDWSFIKANATDTIEITGGQLRLGGDRDQPTQFQLLAAPVGAFTASVDLGAWPGNGSYNIGVLIGENEIVFHPGFGGTALRVEGLGGFDNQNVGFTLAPEVLHHLTLTGDGFGLFTITLTDALNAGNTYTTSFVNAGSVGGLFSISRAGVNGLYGQVYADNFLLTDESISPVPDTSSTFSLMLLGTGSLGCFHCFRRRRA